MQMSCPQCASKSFKRNGYTRHGKQNHRCLDCGRQFSFDTFYVESNESNERLPEQASPALSGTGGATLVGG